MKIFDHDAHCKQCEEEVLYTWKECPYCGSRRFVRQSSVFDVTKTIIEYCVGIVYRFLCVSVIIYTFFLISFIAAIDAKKLGIAVIGLLLVTIALVALLVYLLFLLLEFIAAFCLYYIIQPFLHYFGKKITITDIVRGDYSFTFQKTAIKYLTNQSVVTEIALSDEKSWIREAAVENKNLTDQSVLAEIAKTDEYYSVRRAAVKKLTDQSVLADIAKKDKDSYVREAAVEKLTDQRILAEIALSDESVAVKKAAIKNFDAKNLQLLPEIVEQVFPYRATYISSKERDFVQFAYQISLQEQKPILREYNERAIEIWDDYSDNSYSDDYFDYYSHHY